MIGFQTNFKWVSTWHEASSHLGLVCFLIEFLTENENNVNMKRKYQNEWIWTGYTQLCADGKENGFMYLFVYLLMHPFYFILVVTWMKQQDLSTKRTWDWMLLSISTWKKDRNWKRFVQYHHSVCFHSIEKKADMFYTQKKTERYLVVQLFSFNCCTWLLTMAVFSWAHFQNCSDWCQRISL